MGWAKKENLESCQPVFINLKFECMLKSNFGKINTLKYGIQQFRIFLMKNYF